jgi:hypothetical protein
LVGKIGKAYFFREQEGQKNRYWKKNKNKTVTKAITKQSPDFRKQPKKGARKKSGKAYLFVALYHFPFLPSF